MDFGYDDWEEGLETPLVDDCDEYWPSCSGLWYDEYSVETG